MSGKSSARFAIENGRILRIHRLEKVTFVTIYAQGSKYAERQEVTSFETVPFEVGASVTVTGDLSNRKRKDSGRYEATHIARRWSEGKEELTPAAPEQRAQEAQPVDDSDIPF